MSTASADGTVSRAQIEGKLREIRESIDGEVEKAKVPLAAVAAVVVAGIVVGAYMIGRRRGRKRTTVVEIRRV